MAIINIEFKNSGPDAYRHPQHQAGGHAGANASYDALATWGNAASLPAGTTSVIVANLDSASAVAVALSSDADPTGYHVILPQTQRELFLRADTGSIPLKAKSL